MHIKNTKRSTRLLTWLIFGIALLEHGLASTEVEIDSIASCLKAWGNHPFDKNPQFKIRSSGTVAIAPAP
jgi:hypothetical protein